MRFRTYVPHSDFNLGVRGGPIPGGALPAVASSRWFTLPDTASFQPPIRWKGFCLKPPKDSRSFLEAFVLPYRRQPEVSL